MDKLTQALNFRHACKVFDETKKIPSSEIDYILEAGRRSPSSFGMEPWHFVIISNDDIKEKLSPICYNQPQIKSCSHLVIVLHRNSKHFTAESEYLRSTVLKNLPEGSNEQEIEKAIQYFITYRVNQLPKNITIENWAEMQCYIASANMLTAAAFHEIDSCAIAGYQNELLIDTLENLNSKLNKEEFGISLCLAFGYRKNEAVQNKKWAKEDITTFI